MSYRRYPPRPPMSAQAVAVVAGLVLLAAVLVALLFPDGKAGAAAPSATYQGRTATWWAHRAVQARKDANARRATIHRLRRTLRYDPTITEAVRLATIAYPSFTEARAWAIIRHESQGDPNARNEKPVGDEHASGLYQFLPSTFASTPYGRLSIWNPYAASLAAGWMHEQGRRCEWWC